MTTSTTRPRVGYGMPYDDEQLVVSCPRCKAAPGEPCTKRSGGYHLARGDKVDRLVRKASFTLFERLENEALNRDPDGPLWQYEGAAHRCGVAGAHALTDCIAVADTEAGR
jgi:hypothetical protein